VVEGQEEEAAETLRKPSLLLLPPLLLLLLCFLAKGDRIAREGDMIADCCL
jgi:hypothetical protein